jgi:hypothetical protein
MIIGTKRRRRRSSAAVSAFAPPTRFELRDNLIAGLVVVSGLCMAVAAPAEERPEPDRLLSVLQNAVDSQIGTGMRVGTAIIAPSLDLGGAYDSNVFAKNHDARSDWYASVIPRIDILSDWPRNSFSLTAQGEFRQYATYSRENTGDASIEGSGRIDLASNAYLLAGGGYQLLHEDRGALVPAQGVNPTQFTVASAKAGFVLEPAPLGLRLDATADSYGYNNIMLPGGAAIGEGARDRVVFALTPRVTYQMVPQYNAFLQAVVNRRQYNSTREPDGLNRSSTGYAINLGTSFDLAGFAAGEAYLGFLNQGYDSRLAGSISAFDFGGKLEWRPTASTSVRLNLSRSIEESAILGSPGYLQTAVRLGIEQALQPRFLLLGSLGYINSNFAGPGGSSDLYEARIGTRYIINTGLTADLGYSFGLRASTPNLPRYTRQIVELRLRGQL